MLVMPSLNGPDLSGFKIAQNLLLLSSAGMILNKHYEVGRIEISPSVLIARGANLAVFTATAERENRRFEVEKRDHGRSEEEWTAVDRRS